MHSPAHDIMAGYPGGCVADKDANPETTLGSAYSPVDYMSITSFPRLPEDDGMSAENALKSRREDDNALSEQDTGQSRLQFRTKFPPTKIRVFWFLDVGSPRSTACHLNLKEPFSIRLKKKVELGRQLLIIVTIG